MDSNSTEREAFEAYFAASRKSKGVNKRPSFDRLGDDTYADDHTQRHWWTWQQARRSQQPATAVPAELERRVYMAEGLANQRSQELASAQACIAEWVDYGAKITEALGEKVLSPNQHVGMIEGLVKAVSAGFPVVSRWTTGAHDAGPRARVWVQFEDGGAEIEFGPATPPAQAASPITVEWLQDLRNGINTLAALSLKAERHRLGSELKATVSAAIAALAAPTVAQAASPDQTDRPHLFELWWERYMPTATQGEAWEAWKRASVTDRVSAALTALSGQDAAKAEPIFGKSNLVTTNEQTIRANLGNGLGKLLIQYATDDDAEAARVALWRLGAAPNNAESRCEAA